MNPTMPHGLVPGGAMYARMDRHQAVSPGTGDVMACSPYSRGSSTSPSSHNSPGPYPVKAEPMLQALHTMTGPRLVILEEPQERFRFRYESELGGTHGQLAGRSGADRRSFPTVKLEGFHQRATIRCELFTVEETGSSLAPVPHVHTLQGRNCSGGIAEMRVDAENDFTASFQGLGIIHTAKKQMVDKIMNRKLDEKKIAIERQHQGKLWTPNESDKMEAREQANRESQRINMNRVCLRFRALFQNPQTMRHEDICAPIFSGPIFNGKSAQTGELKIVQISEAYSPCTGNKEIWLLVERVRKNDIKVLLYEEDDNQQVVWQDYARVIKCHHQYAIILQTPPYKDKDLRSPRRVQLQLERPSDGCVSEPKNFQYTERDQRTTKRTMVNYPDPVGSKRIGLHTEAGTTHIEMPPRENFQEIFRALQPEYPPFRNFLQQQAPPPQHPQRSPQQQPQPSPQMPGPSPQYFQQPSPFSPSSVSTASPQMAQEQMYGSPQHQPFGQQQGMLMSQDPMLAGAHRQPMGVDEVLSENIPLTVPHTVSSAGAGLATHGGQGYTHPYYQQAQGLHQPTMVNVPGDQALGQVAEEMMHYTPDQLQELISQLPAGAMDDCIQGPPRAHRAPRGVAAVRGIGSETEGAAQSADQLADSVARINLDGQTPADAADRQNIDLNRPEVKLALSSTNFLYLFAATGDVNILLEHFRCLVGMENYDGDNVLHVAAFFSQAEAMARLLEAISGMPAELKETMIDSPNANRQTPLHLAVLAGGVDCVQLLLAAGAQSRLVDRDGNTAVHLAAQAGGLHVLKLLLDHLNKSGECDKLLQQTNYHGFSALHVAVEAGRREAVVALCEAGADVNAKDDTEGRAPLHLAVQNKDMEMSRLLLSPQLGAAVDPLTFGDVTPLHVACRLGGRRLAALLVAAGADPGRRSVERLQSPGSGTESADEDAESAGDEERLDAFMYAQMAGDTTLEQMLRGRVHMPSPESDPEQEQEQEAAPAPQLEAAGGKKGAMDSGMDSGLGITQELTSQTDVTSPTDGNTADDGEARDRLPAPAAARLANLLDKSVDTWRNVALLLELDVTSVEHHRSPTDYILRCVAKYDNLSLEYLGQVLGTLGLSEAQQIVLRNAPK